MDDLKKETERDLQCYELCHTELHDAMDQCDAQEVQISTRDALIEELKRQKADLEKTLENNESYCHQQGMHLAHTFRRVVEQYNTETQTFRVTDNIGSFYTWMNNELKLLSGTMSKVGDYRAAMSIEAILYLLEEHGCDHFKTFSTQGFSFPSSEDLPAPSKMVDTITKIALCNFWAKSGREHAQKEATDRLAKVCILLFITSIGCLC
jgi:hypothetical protein